MTLENELQEFVSREVLTDTDGGLVDVNDALITSGRIDSMALLTIVNHIRDKHNVDVMACGEPSDFDTISGLAAAIQRAQQG